MQFVPYSPSENLTIIPGVYCTQYHSQNSTHAADKATGLFIIDLTYKSATHSKINAEAQVNVSTGKRMCAVYYNRVTVLN